MGNRFGSNNLAALNPDSAWKLQNQEMMENPMYQFADLAKGGRLIKAYEDHGPDRVKEIARTEMVHFLYQAGKGSIITRQDYTKWCKLMRAKTSAMTYVEKNEEEAMTGFQEDRFNKFEPHEACWDLFKRGGVGETPFHLCYLMDTPVHFEVGRALLEVFPKLALDVYEGEEYFGESSLHIAVILGDLDAVQLLVENGANIHQRATGRFFLPEDQKKKNSVKETNYYGYCYYGEYPLAFAACRGSEVIYDFLIDHGADPNAQDSFGNTVLHMVVIHQQTEMFKHAVRHHKHPARTDILNKQRLTPLTMASKLGRAHIFKEILNLGSIEFWRFSNTTCSAYPLAALDSIGPDGETNWHSALMMIVSGESDEHLDMLEGGVIRQLLDDKWRTFARKRFIERLIIAFIHLVLLSVAIYTRPKDEQLLDYSGPKDAVRYFAELMVCLNCLITVIMESIDLVSQGSSSFLRNHTYAPDQLVNLLSCLLIMMCIPMRLLKFYRAEDMILIIAAPSSWCSLLFFARGVKLTGPFVTMIYKMLSGDLFRFAIIYCIFLVGFTQGFYFLFHDVQSQDQDVEKFSTLQDTILTLFQMTLGEFKYAAFNCSRYSPLTKVVFVIFMVLMPILLLNMLIAMMGNTYNQVIARSEKEWRRQWAKIVVILERGFSKKSLLKYQQDYSVRLAGPLKHQLAGCYKAGMEQRALVVIKSANKSRAKISKGAVVNWKRLGKEVVRQMREWQAKGSRGQFAMHKRRGTVALDDFGLLNLSGAVTQLAWEKDMNFCSSQTAGILSSLSETDDSGHLPQHLPALDTSGLRVAGQEVVTGSRLPNGMTVLLAQHQQLVSTPIRCTHSLQYSNRVAPLFPPLPQGADKAVVLTHTEQVPLASDKPDGVRKRERKATLKEASVMSLDLKSLSSWQSTVNPEQPPQPSTSCTKNQAVRGGFQPSANRDCLSSQADQHSSCHAVRDIEKGRLALPISSAFKDTQSREIATNSGTPVLLYSPEHTHWHTYKMPQEGSDSSYDQSSSSNSQPDRNESADT